MTGSALFTIFNTVGSLLEHGCHAVLCPHPLPRTMRAATRFRRVLPHAGSGGHHVISILLTLLAVIGIWKDQPELLWHRRRRPRDQSDEVHQIIRNNDPMQRLMMTGAGCKLTFFLKLATNTTVLYAHAVRLHDERLRQPVLPMMVLGYVFNVPF